MHWMYGLVRCLANLVIAEAVFFLFFFSVSTVDSNFARAVCIWCILSSHWCDMTLVNLKLCYVRANNCDSVMLYLYAAFLWLVPVY